jgi:hypothetical protein
MPNSVAASYANDDLVISFFPLETQRLYPFQRIGRALLDQVPYNVITSTLSERNDMIDYQAFSASAEFTHRSHLIASFPELVAVFSLRHAHGYSWSKRIASHTPEHSR